MLINNSYIQDIKYTPNEENKEKIAKFKSIQHKSYEEIIDTLEKQNSDYDHELSCGQKACLPLWCWKSFIHAKHEAFRFKYDVDALKLVEEMMPSMTRVLYINSIVYYIIMFVCPFVFVNECGLGMNMTAHYIYMVYSLATAFFEGITVIRIQNRINNKNILQFNRWHFVELLMG